MWILFSKYILVGLANTLITIVVIFTLMHFDIGVYVANATGYVVGIIFSFIVNSLFTFSSKLNFANLIKFFTACFISYLVNLATMKIFLTLFAKEVYSAILDKLTSFLHLHVQYPNEIYFATLCGMVSYTVIGFILNKYWVMK